MRCIKEVKKVTTIDERKWHYNLEAMKNERGTIFV